MSETRNATIRVRQVKKGLQPVIGVTNKKGGEIVVALNPAHLSPVLAELFKQNLASLAGVAVEYEWAGGQVCKVRRAGETWKEPASIPAARKPSPEEGSMFENPYNFVPAPPRKATGTDLDDTPPAGQHRYHRGRWSGRIGVRLTTITPLLIPDAARSRSTEQDNSADPRHRVFGLRLDPDGVPYLPPTSVKGMLRAAYEAVTNSRMGVFTGHEEPLAFRHAAAEGADLVPARISDCGDFVDLQPGFTNIGHDGVPEKVGGNPPVLYAAWIPQWKGHQILLTSGNDLVKHKELVWAELELWEHWVSKHRKPWTNNFDLWRVVRLEPGAPSAPTSFSPANVQRTLPSHDPEKSQRHLTPKGSIGRAWRLGWVCKTYRNIGNKHDERFVFVEKEHPQSGLLREPLTPDLRRRWRVLIENYRAEHEKEIQQGIHSPPALHCAPCSWSRHILEAKNEKRLEPKAVCYAKVKSRPSDGFEILGLYPVTISRDLYACAPHEFLDDTLLPAVGPGNFSPADRVFGWVKQGGRGAWRGQLRVGPVKCEQGEDAIKKFGGDGVTLAILGQPKPQQARFYAAENKDGEPLDSNRRKGEGYTDPKADGLRGRKIYSHQPQTLITDYWEAGNPPINAVEESFEERKVWREFMRQPNPEKDKPTRSSQNRSVTQWVKPKMEFTFDVRVENLSELELGALLWLVTLDPNLYLRLGGGKPLGFGSVQLSLTGLDLRDGAALAEDYGRLLERGGGGQRMLVDMDLAKCSGVRRAIQCFEDAVGYHYGNGRFLDAPFIRAFVNACRGGSLPVHYPRIGEEPNGRGENFKWFGENEKKGRHALPALYEDDRGLPDYTT